MADGYPLWAGGQGEVAVKLRRPGRVHVLARPHDAPAPAAVAEVVEHAAFVIEAPEAGHVVVGEVPGLAPGRAYELFCVAAAADGSLDDHITALAVELEPEPEPEAEPEPEPEDPPVSTKGFPFVANRSDSGFDVVARTASPLHFVVLRADAPSPTDPLQIVKRRLEGMVAAGCVTTASAGAIAAVHVADLPPNEPFVIYAVAEGSNAVTVLQTTTTSKETETEFVEGYPRVVGGHELVVQLKAPGAVRFAVLPDGEPVPELSALAHELPVPDAQVIAGAPLPPPALPPAQPYVLYAAAGQTMMAVPFTTAAALPAGGRPALCPGFPHIADVGATSFELAARLTAPGRVRVLARPAALAPPASMDDAPLPEHDATAVLPLPAAGDVHAAVLAGLQPDTDYAAYVVVESPDGAFRDAVVSVLRLRTAPAPAAESMADVVAAWLRAAPDTTPTATTATTRAPAKFVPGFPRAVAGADGGFSLVAQLQDVGVVRFVVLPAGAAAPSAADVCAGRAYGGAAPVAAGEIRLDGAPGRMDMAHVAAQPGTAYAVYAATSEAGEVAEVEVVTPASANHGPTDDLQGYPCVRNVTAEGFELVLRGHGNTRFSAGAAEGEAELRPTVDTIVPVRFGADGAPVTVTVGDGEPFMVSPGAPATAAAEEAAALPTRNLGTGYPHAARITADGFDLVAQLRSAGDVFFLPLPGGSPAPTSHADIRERGQRLAIGSDRDIARARVSGLAADAAFDVYVFGESDGRPDSVVTLLRVHTRSPEVDAHCVAVTGSSLEVVGAVRFAVVPAGGPCPSSEGWLPGDVAATGLAPATDYDVHCETPDGHTRVLHMTTASPDSTMDNNTWVDGFPLIHNVTHESFDVVARLAQSGKVVVTVDGDPNAAVEVDAPANETVRVTVPAQPATQHAVTVSPGDIPLQVETRGLARLCRGYPRIAHLHPHSFTLVAQLSRPGAVHFVVAREGEANVPGSVAALRQGHVPGAVSHGRLELHSADDVASAEVLELDADAAYSVFVLSEEPDGSAPDEEVTVLRVHTRDEEEPPEEHHTLRRLQPGYPRVVSVSSDGFSLLAQAAEPGELLFAVVPRDAAGPSTVDEMREGFPGLLQLGAAPMAGPASVDRVDVVGVPPETALDVYALFVDAAGAADAGLSVVAVRTPAARPADDEVAELAAGFPRLTRRTATGFDVCMQMAAGEGTAWVLVLAADAPPPRTVGDVRDSMPSALAHAALRMPDPGRVERVALTGLPEGAACSAYVLCDADPTIRVMQVPPFTSAPAGLIEQGFPFVAGASPTAFSLAAQLRQPDGRLHYVVVPEGAQAPSTLEELTSEPPASAVASGTIECPDPALVETTVIGGGALEPEATYRVFTLAAGADGAADAAMTCVSASTTAPNGSASADGGMSDGFPFVAGGSCVVQLRRPGVVLVGVERDGQHDGPPARPTRRVEVPDAGVPLAIPLGPLVAGSAYEVVALVEGERSMSVMKLVAPTAAPRESGDTGASTTTAMVDGWPRVRDIAAHEFTLEVNLVAPVRCAFLVRPADAEAPSAEEVARDGTAIEFGEGHSLAGAAHVTGLQSLTAYAVYVGVDVPGAGVQPLHVRTARAASVGVRDLLRQRQRQRQQKQPPQATKSPFGHRGGVRARVMEFEGFDAAPQLPPPQLAPAPMPSALKFKGGGGGGAAARGMRVRVQLQGAGTGGHKGKPVTVQGDDTWATFGAKVCVKLGLMSIQHIHDAAGGEVHSLGDLREGETLWVTGVVRRKKTAPKGLVRIGGGGEVTRDALLVNAAVHRRLSAAGGGVGGVVGPGVSSSSPGEV